MARLVLLVTAGLGLHFSRIAAASSLDCSRIVSLSPSITETLYALELEDKIVGVTRYANYPPEVKELPVIGGFLDPNYEAILLAKPTIVVYLPSHENKLDKLKKLGLQTLALNYDSISNVMEAIESLGRSCSRQQAAVQLTADLRLELEKFTKLTKDKKRIRTMVVIAGATNSLRDIYLSGSDGYFSELLDTVGGANVHDGKTVAMPTISAEGIIALNPEVIIEIHPPHAKPTDDFKEKWESVPGVSAVRNGKIFALKDDYMYVPGPRLGLALKKMYSVLRGD